MPWSQRRRRCHGVLLLPIWMRRTAFGVAFCLYVVNPLLIQHSMLIDADTTGTAVFMALFAYLFIRFENRPTRSFVAERCLLAGVLTFAFLSKEITPFFIFVGLVFYRIFNREWMKLLKECFLIFLSSVLVAWLVWWIFCLFAHT